MFTVLSTTIIAILLALYIAELIARRQADRQAALLKEHLQDAISCELDQHEEIERLRECLITALRERNAANLRAKRAARSTQALPALTIRCPLPAEQTGAMPFNLN